MNASVLRYLCLWLCVCCVLPQPGWGCAFDDSEDYNFPTVFRQDLVDLPQRSFFMLTYEKQPWPERTEASNYAAWKKLAPESTDDNVHALVYTASTETLQRLHAHIKSNEQRALQAEAQPGAAPQGQTPNMPLPTVFANNRLAKALVQHNRTDVLDYLLFIRSVAPITNIKEDDWEYTVPDREAAYVFVAQAEKRFLTTQDTFLRLRYGFQALRLYYLLQDYNKAINLFEANAATLPPQAEETYWMRSYYGGALFRALRKTEALSQFAQGFMHSPRYSERGYTGAKWSTSQEDDFQKHTLPAFTEALGKATTAQEREALLILGAYFETHGYTTLPKPGGPLFTLLEEAAKTGLIPPDLPLLVSRFIYKAEQALFDPLYVRNTLHPFTFPATQVVEEQSKQISLQADLADHQQAADEARAVLHSMNPLVERIWAEASEPHFWGATAAHVSLMQGNVEEAKQRIAKGKTQNPPQRMADQLRMTSAILTALYAPFTPEMETTLVAELGWLTQVPPKKATAKDDEKIEEEVMWRFWAANTILRTILSPRYAALHKPGPQFYAHLAWKGIKKPCNFPHWESESYSLYSSALQWPMLFYGEGHYTYVPLFSQQEYPALEAFMQAPKTPLEAYLVEKSPITYTIAHQDNAEGLHISYMTLSSEEDTDNNSLLLREPQRAFGWNKPPESLPAPLNENIMIAQNTLPASVQALMQQTPLGSLPAPLLQQYFTTLTQQVNHGAPYLAGKQNTAHALGLLMALPGEAGASALYAYGKFQYNQGYIEPTYQFPYESEKETLQGYALLQAAQPFNTNIPNYRLKAAAEAFSRAAAQTQNSELAARALFMAQLAAQMNNDTSSSYRYDNKVLQNQANASPYFARLVKDYTNTRFYQEARRQCSLLRDFSPAPHSNNAAPAHQ